MFLTRRPAPSPVPLMLALGTAFCASAQASCSPGSLHGSAVFMMPPPPIGKLQFDYLTADRKHRQPCCPPRTSTSVLVEPIKRSQRGHPTTARKRPPWKRIATLCTAPQLASHEQGKKSI